MSNPIRRWSWGETVNRVYISTGNTWNGSWPKSGQHYLTKTKSSVDTGFFVPNVYRVNPYSVSSVVVKESSFSSSYTATYGNIRDTCYIAGDVAGIGPYQTNFFGLLDANPHPNPGTLPKLALQKARGNVSASLMDLGVELGELKETLQMLRSPFKDLRKFCDLSDFRTIRRALTSYIRTGRYASKSGREAAKAATSTWMEARYGLRPLFNSIAAISELVSEGLPSIRPDKIYSAHGSAKADVGTDRLGEKLIVNGSYTDIYGHVTIDHRQEAYAAVQYRYTDIPTLAELLGLAPQHIPEIAWELTRLSFVVDWFYGIGPWLSSLRIQPNVHILGNTVGTKNISTLKVYRPYSQYYYEPGSSYPASVNLEIVRSSYNRAVNASGGGPQLIAGQLMDLAKAVDLLVIMYQNIKF